MTNTDHEKLQKAASEATDVVVRRVHAVAFFNKLAEYGIKPSTEQEAKELLELGFKLAAVPQQPEPRSKQASAFGVALDALKQVTGEPTSGEASRTNEIYAYANHFMQDAEVVKSAALLNTIQKAYA